MTSSLSDVALFLDPTAWWLPIVDAVFKATVVLLLAAAAATTLRRASAASRHLIWTIGLTGALAVPVMTAVLPRWQVAAFTVDTLGTGRSQPSAPVARDPGSPLRPPASPVSSHMASGNAVTTPWQEEASSASFSFGPTLLLIWVTGALFILMRLVAGLLAVAWMSRRTQIVINAPWLLLARELAVRLGVRRVAFRKSARMTMPMACGIVRPAVLMPADADAWPSDRLRIVLLHELAHVKRRDCLIHVLAQLACAVHWFNPLTWIAARQIRTERERACDDLVLTAGTRGPDYAEQLLEIARMMRRGSFPVLLGGATLAMAHRTQLEGRLLAILDSAAPRAGLSRSRAAAMVLGSSCVLMLFASLQPWAHAQQQSIVQTNTGTVATEAADEQDMPPRPLLTSTTLLGPRRVVSSPATAELTREVIDYLDKELPAGVLDGVLTNVVPATVDEVMDRMARAAGGVQDRGSQTDRRTVDALAGALKDPDADVREAAIQALARLRDPALFEPLVQALRDSSADVREHAVFALGQLKDARAMQPLMAALKDESPGVREQAAFAMGQLRDPGALDALALAIRDPKANVREQAAFALGQIRDKRAVSPLISALKDSEANVREQAAFALGQVRDPAGVDALVVAIKDTEANVREQAAFALGQIRDPRAIDALTAALKDSNAQVRQQAAFALGQLAR